MPTPRITRERKIGQENKVFATAFFNDIIKRKPRSMIGLRYREPLIHDRHPREN
jgi:hypothetical protein